MTTESIGKYCLCKCCWKSLGWRSASKISRSGATYCKEHARFASAKDPQEAYLAWRKQHDTRTDAEKKRDAKKAERAFKKFQQSLAAMNRAVAKLREGGAA